jgi:hypothetical protein
MVEAPGFSTLVTSLYPEGDKYLTSDAVFGVKKSLIVVSDPIDLRFRFEDDELLTTLKAPG